MQWKVRLSLESLDARVLPDAGPLYPPPSDGHAYGSGDTSYGSDSGSGSGYSDYGPGGDSGSPSSGSGSGSGSGGPIGSGSYTDHYPEYEEAAYRALRGRLDFKFFASSGAASAGGRPGFARVASSGTSDGWR